jgi:hypothetical protein
MKSISPKLSACYTTTKACNHSGAQASIKLETLPPLAHSQHQLLGQCALTESRRKHELVETHVRLGEICRAEMDANLRITHGREIQVSGILRTDAHSDFGDGWEETRCSWVGGDLRRNGRERRK